MTTGDEEAEGLVDDLFREVDDQFDDLEREYTQAREELALTSPDPAGAAVPAAPSESAGGPIADDLTAQVDDRFDDLEREYSQARQELATTSPERPDTPSNALEASKERFELMSQVATLQAELSRQGDELDERDRMLTELGDKIVSFESEIAQRDAVSTELHAARQETLDERREQARLSALLDARAAERQELADVANRLQNERDHVQELLTTALARYDEAEAAMVQMDDKVRHLEAARDTTAHEHDARAHELIESRAEMSKLADRLDEMAKTAADADQRAEKSEALAERRANEAGYLNRRIDAMNDKLDAATSFEDDAANLRRELTMAERRITELERDLATEQSEAAAARAAVDAIAERTSDYDELVTTIERLREERDEAWEAASGHAPAEPAEPVEQPAPVPEPSAEVSSLAARARELSSRRANEAAIAAEEAAAQAAAAQAANDAAPADAAPDDAAADDAAPDEAAVDDTPAEPESDDELLDLDDDDLDVIEADLAELEPSAATQAAPAAPAPASVPLTDIEVPVFEFGGADDAGDVVLPRVAESVPEAEPVAVEAADLEPVETVAAPAVAITDTAEIPAVDVGVGDAEPVAVDEIPLVSLDHLAAPAGVEVPTMSGLRKRTILPAELEPNTPDAVSYLLNQQAVIAIVDARSTCGRTGIRPSELFERVAELRDHFDVPVEVVVTPVSTPVGGAPDLPAIGVHHVTGADTVADRIRALCMGFPADQPLVVIAGDDHVRRAAIGEEANVVEPTAVLNLPTS